MMQLFIKVLFWAGLLFIGDGAFGLIFEEKWQKLARGLDIRRLALLEVGVGFLLIVLHYVLSLSA